MGGLEVIAVVGGFLIAHPLGLRLGALVMLCGIVEPAIPAGMKVSAAGGTLLAAANPFTRFDFEGFAAFPTEHKKAGSRELEAALGNWENAIPIP